MTVLIAGGGIAGLALGLTLHQIGVPFRIFEQVRSLKPLGVGINLQPTAVRELFDLGLADQIDAIGVKTEEYGLFSSSGREVWIESRGRKAGYDWPQYSVHRGHLHMMLYDAVQARAGHGAVETGWLATGFSNAKDAVTLHLQNRTGQTRDVDGCLLVGADGIHSAIRAQMEPDEGAPTWSGQMLWRGTTMGAPFRTGASMVMIGAKGLRFVSYPISKPDPRTGLQELNWIANIHGDPTASYRKEDWARLADLNDFLPQLRQLSVDWLDIPAMVEKAGKVFEYPMVDRDPIDRWTHGRTTLMGDAAHAAYPVGSNGAGSAIIDARRIGAAILDNGLTPAALEAYETATRPAANKVVLMNRTAGPDSILDVVEERSGGVFDDINEVIPVAEMAAHADRYKAAAGYSVADTNATAPTIPPGARARVG